MGEGRGSRKGNHCRLPKRPPGRVSAQGELHAVVGRVHTDGRRYHRAGALYARCRACARPLRARERPEAHPVEGTRTSAHRRSGADIRPATRPRRLAPVPHQPRRADGCGCRGRQVRQHGEGRRGRVGALSHRQGCAARQGTRDIEIPCVRRRAGRLRHRHTDYGREGRRMGQRQADCRPVHKEHGRVLWRPGTLGGLRRRRLRRRAYAHRRSDAAKAEQHVGCAEPRPRV